MECQHIFTRGRDGETGSWCCACGVKTLAVETRACGGCAHHRRLIDGSICRRHWMAIVPSMLVCYKITKGTCFEPAAPTGPAQPEGNT
jgi:hypothetical protein